MKAMLFCLLMFIAIATGSAQATDSTMSYPPILDFYPNCSYDIVKNYSAKNRTADPAKKQQITDKLLLKIRKKAKKVGADAVILVAKKFSRRMNPAKVDIFTIGYDAELIKQCHEDNNQDQRVAAYNHLGEKVTRLTIKSKTKPKNYSHTFTHSNTIVRPEIINNEVSLEHGVYGVKLGVSYQQVIDLFGRPNTVVNLFTKEVIIGYGRRHWLHFQDNKLVKIQTSSALLSQSMLNEIPFLDFFDDAVWKINNTVTYKTPLTAINKTLQTATALNDKHQLIFENNANKLTLFFIKYDDQHNQEAHYLLDGFTLEKNSYRPLNYLAIIRHVVCDE